jgi:hypothetical protein
MGRILDIKKIKKEAKKLEEQYSISEKDFLETVSKEEEDKTKALKDDDVVV